MKVVENKRQRQIGSILVWRRKKEEKRKEEKKEMCMAESKYKEIKGKNN